MDASTFSVVMVPGAFSIESLQVFTDIRINPSWCVHEVFTLDVKEHIGTPVERGRHVLVYRLCARVLEGMDVAFVCTFTCLADRVGVHVHG